MLTELVAARRRAAVLPDDRVRDRFQRRAVPDDRRLSLVRDADRGTVARTHPGRVERRARGDQSGLPDLVRVVLDPAGPGEMLLELAIPAAFDLRAVGDDERFNAGGACVDR